MTELELVGKNLEQAISLREEALVKGQMSSWEEYRFLCGVVAGLKAALEAIKEAEQKYQEV